MNFRVETGWIKTGEHVLAFGLNSAFLIDGRGRIVDESVLSPDNQFAAVARRIVTEHLPRLMKANALKSIGTAKSQDRRAFLGLLAHACNHAAAHEGFGQ
ncbi:hypothetical protein [Roseicyclus amphidinii]|uniref:hypothetical protein n=1 Tax=Roseicyclus amphidinii TaxID=3034232 RepID=UPI0024E0FB31|nr:hypothetical protein [Roseicyclus sp. Amp-Y-6]